MRRLITSSRRDFTIERLINTRGSGSLKAGINKYRSASHVVPHVVLTDLDRYQCPPALLNGWGSVNRTPKFMFRIAVREVEAWLLADREGIAEFLCIPVSKVPRDPEREIDPKRSLVNLARRSRKRRLTEELVPSAGSVAPIGPLYNVRMTEFVNGTWDINRAKINADSLSRTVERLSAFLRA